MNVLIIVHEDLCATTGPCTVCAYGNTERSDEQTDDIELL